ncbi:MAG: LysR family transcriptional regulator [Hyphomicrobiales bacterium]
MSYLRNFDLNLLRVFDAIYDTGSVSAAARKLAVSQPSISRELNRLRDHFDDQLFVRSGNGVAPTAKASSMLVDVRDVLSLIDKTIDVDGGFDPARDARNFKLAIPDLVEVKVLPSIVNRLPIDTKLTFETFAYSDVELDKSFADNDIDAGVFPFIPDAPDLVYRPLFSDQGALITRKNHPVMSNGLSLAIMDKLRFILLPNHIYRLSRLAENLSVQGIKPNVVCTTHKVSSIPQIVSCTDLVSFLPLEYATVLSKAWDIDVFPLPDFQETKQNVYLAYLRGKENDPAVTWLCSEIEAAYAK